MIKLAIFLFVILNLSCSNAVRIVKTLKQNCNVPDIEPLDVDLIAVIACDSKIAIWNSTSEVQLAKLSGHVRNVVKLKGSQESLISGSYDRTLKFYDLNTYLETKSFNISRFLSWFEILSNGDIAYGSLVQNFVPILDRNTGLEVRRLVGHDDWIDSLTLLSNGDLASGSGDKTIIIWNPLSGELIRRLYGHTDSVTCLKILQDGRLISGSRDTTIKIWDPSNGALVKTLTGHTDWIVDLAVLDNGNIVSISFDKTARVWDPKSGNTVGILEEHSGSLSTVRVLPNNLVITGDNEGDIIIWDAE